MFVLYSASNAFQWTQLVIITNILEKYYGVSALAVYWTSMIYMVLYIPLIFPASWLLDKKVTPLSAGQIQNLTKLFSGKCNTVIALRASILRWTDQKIFPLKWTKYKCKA